MCGRDESLPYGLNHKRDLAISCGPGMPGPYGLLFPVTGVRGAWRRATSAASQQSWPARAVACPAGASIAHYPSFAPLNCGPVFATPHLVATARLFFVTFFWSQKKVRPPGRLPLIGHCRACSAASSGGISCFLRLTTPGSLAISPSGSTWNASRMISSALWP